MNIKTILQSIVHHYDSTRRVGHTTLIKKGLENTEEPVLVCLHSNSYAKQFNDNSSKKYEVVSLPELHPKLLGQNKPLVFDNEAMRQLCLMSLEKISELEKKLANNATMIEELRNVMAKYNMLD